MPSLRITSLNLGAIFFGAHKSVGPDAVTLREKKKPELPEEDGENHVAPALPYPRSAAEALDTGLLGSWALIPGIWGCARLCSR